jgi:NADH:ubiquinone oxidoreductase subunit 5 (subunit L)/multisubunit Na+/H+ antiporter MnhA subunit
LARLYPILTLDTRFIAAVVGSVTLIVGAGVALVQTDLRKILAWSTVSQGGYVLLFLGSGGYAAGILHLFTHGFVKTALFLAAGSIIQGLGTADIRQMGGLWKRFPITALGSLLAILALGGAPWLSISYSTNLGLACVYDYAHALQATNGGLIAILLFHIPAVCTYITALGIGRWWWLAFAGTNRNAKLYDAAHESAFLTLPIILLAAFLAGGLYEFAGILPLIGKSIPAILLALGANTSSLVLSGSALARLLVIRETGWAFLGLGVAAFIHLNGLELSNRLRRLPGINILDYWLRERMFFDEVFEGLLLPALLLLIRATGLLEWVGRAFVKIISVLVGGLVGLVAHIEHSTQLKPTPEAGNAPPASPEAEGTAGESLSP